MDARRQVGFVLALMLAQVGYGQWMDWMNQYPYPGHRVYSHIMRPTADGNLLLCGSIHGAWTPGSGIPFEDWAIAMYLVKIQPSGDTLWTLRFDPIKPSSISHMVNLMDGSMLVAGTAQSAWTYCGMASANGPMPQLFAMKIDPMGAVVWWHQYDQPCTRILVDAWETPDQAIHLLVMNTQQPNIIIGYTPPSWFESYTLDPQGGTISVAPQPSSTYYSPQTGCAAITSGRHVFASFLDTVGVDHVVLHLMRFDDQGAQLSSTLLSDTLYKVPRRIITTLDQGLLMLACSEYTSSRILHSDTLGNIVWDRVYPYQMVDVVELPDTTYLAIGTVGTWQSQDMRQLRVTHLSAIGDSLGSHLYGDSLNDMGSSILASMNAFIAFGTKDMYSGSVPPRLFITWDSFDISTGGADRPLRDASLRLSPVPADRQLGVRSMSATDLGKELLVLDALGRPVRREQVNPGADEYWIDVSELAPGPYFILAIGADHTAVGRFIIQH